MNIFNNHSLRSLNTFGIGVATKYFAEVSTVDELKSILLNPEYTKHEKMILTGGGSNVLFTKDFDGLIIKNSIKGIELEREDADFYFLKSGAGENWHELVLYCVRNNYSGIENLSLIPGNVGAAPIQNIGAYGVELKDVFYELDALNKETCEIKTFSHANCRFGYRDSVFKNELKNQYVIVSVTLKLKKKPVFNTKYGAIEKELEAMGVKGLSIAAVSQAVCNIRSSKLPDPSKIGNAGSFFKNPTISNEQFELLKRNFPDIVGYKNSENTTKLAAGWLIEQCGWKGKRFGDAGVHKDQALVLVNYGKVKGSEILSLSERILQSVKEKFDVELEREVNIV